MHAGPISQVIAASPSIISGLANGTRYLCSLAARNSAGYSTESVNAAGVPTAPPSAPKNVSATAGNGSITLNWDNPADNGGSAVLDYFVVCSAPGTSNSQVTTSTSATLSGRAPVATTTATFAPAILPARALRPASPMCS